MGSERSSGQMPWYVHYKSMEGIKFKLYSSAASICYLIEVVGAEHVMWIGAEIRLWVKSPPWDCPLGKTEKASEKLVDFLKRHLREGVS